MPQRRAVQSSTLRRDVVIVAVTFLLALLLSQPAAVLQFQQDPKFTPWFDQGQYLLSAKAFFHADLSASQHWYPPLYSLLLAPFAWAPVLVQTGVVDLACYALTFIGFREVAQRLGVGSMPALLLFLFSTLASGRMTEQWLLAWTTTPSAALIWLALAWTGRVIAREGAAALSTGAAARLGVVLALIPVCRPGDVAVSAIIGTFALGGLLVHGPRWAQIRALVLAGVAVVVAALALHLAIYGFRPSPYMVLSAAYGANFAWLGWKSYLLLIEPMPWYPYGEGLLRVLPWLPIGAAGLLLALGERALRWQVALLLLPALAYAIIMLAYIDLLPSGMWQLNNAHYFKWLLPLFALGGWLFMLRLKSRTVAALAVLALVLLASAIRLDPVLAAPGEGARMVVFRAPPEGPATTFFDVYFARSSITDARGPMRHWFDYHQVPALDGTVRAEALRRDFAGNEAWYGQARDVKWPYVPTVTHDKGGLPGDYPQLALARYRPKLAIGWPCWLPPYACARPLPVVTD